MNIQANPNATNSEMDSKIFEFPDHNSKTKLISYNLESVFRLAK